MNRCITCGKSFHHSLILPDGREAPQCLQCATKAEQADELETLEPVNRVAEPAPRTPSLAERHGHPHRHRAHRQEPEAEGGGDGEPHPRHHHEHHNYDARDELKKAWVAISVLSVVGFLLVYGIWSKGAAEANAKQQETEAIQRLFDDVQTMLADTGSLANARAAVAAIDAKRELWQRSIRVTDMESLRQQAEGRIKSLEEGQNIDGTLQTIEQALADPALAPTRFPQLHTDAVAATMRGRGLSGVAFERASKMQRDVADRWLTVLQQDAASRSGAEALLAYGEAERQAAVMQQKSDQTRSPLSPDFKSRIEQLAIASDAVCQRVVTADYLAKVPVTDLIAPSMMEQWRPSQTEGLTYGLQGGGFTVANSSPEGGRSGVIVIGYGDYWRDLVLEFDCTLQSGKLRIYLRLAGAPDPQRIACVAIGSDGDLPLQPGSRGRGRISVLGETLRASMDGVGEIEVDIGRKPRLGGIGLVLPPQTRAQFTKLTMQKVR